MTAAPADEGGPWIILASYAEPGFSQVSVQVHEDDPIVRVLFAGGGRWVDARISPSLAVKLQEALTTANGMLRLRGAEDITPPWPADDEEGQG